MSSAVLDMALGTRRTQAPPSEERSDELSEKSHAQSLGRSRRATTDAPARIRITHLLIDVVRKESCAALDRGDEGVEVDNYMAKGVAGRERRDRGSTAMRATETRLRIYGRHRRQPLPAAKPTRRMERWGTEGLTRSRQQGFRRRWEAGREGMQETADPGRRAGRRVSDGRDASRRVGACSPRETARALSGTVTSWDTTTGGREGGRGCRVARDRGQNMQADT